MNPTASNTTPASEDTIPSNHADTDTDTAATYQDQTEEQDVQDNTHLVLTQLIRDLMSQIFEEPNHHSCINGILIVCKQFLEQFVAIENGTHSLDHFPALSTEMKRGSITSEQFSEYMKSAIEQLDMLQNSLTPERDATSQNTIILSNESGELLPEELLEAPERLEWEALLNEQLIPSKASIHEELLLLRDLLSKDIKSLESSEENANNSTDMDLHSSIKIIDKHAYEIATISIEDENLDAETATKMLEKFTQYLHSIRPTESHGIDEYLDASTEAAFNITQQTRPTADTNINDSHEPATDSEQKNLDELSNNPLDSERDTNMNKITLENTKLLHPDSTMHINSTGAPLNDVTASGSESEDGMQYDDVTGTSEDEMQYDDVTDTSEDEMQDDINENTSEDKSDAATAQEVKVTVQDLVDQVVAKGDKSQDDQTVDTLPSPDNDNDSLSEDEDGPSPRPRSASVPNGIDRTRSKSIPNAIDRTRSASVSELIRFFEEREIPKQSIPDNHQAFKPSLIDNHSNHENASEDNSGREIEAIIQDLVNQAAENADKHQLDQEDRLNDATGSDSKNESDASIKQEVKVTVQDLVDQVAAAKNAESADELQKSTTTEEDLLDYARATTSQSNTMPDSDVQYSITYHPATEQHPAFIQYSCITQNSIANTIIYDPSTVDPFMKKFKTKTPSALTQSPYADQTDDMTSMFHQLGNTSYSRNIFSENFPLIIGNTIEISKQPIRHNTQKFQRSMTDNQSDNHDTIDHSPSKSVSDIIQRFESARNETLEEAIIRNYREFQQSISPNNQNNGEGLSKNKHAFSHRPRSRSAPSRLVIDFKQKTAVPSIQEKIGTDIIHGVKYQVYEKKKSLHEIAEVGTATDDLNPVQVAEVGVATDISQEYQSELRLEMQALQKKVEAIHKDLLILTAPKHLVHYTAAAALFWCAALCIVAKLLVLKVASVLVKDPERQNRLKDKLEETASYFGRVENTLGLGVFAEKAKASTVTSHTSHFTLAG